tara:strand:+ start:300 stop:677 length:378 start_codon:yes stop_codon:yes gene_type:complete
MPEINKSKIKSIKKQDQWNDLFKFEIKFENGSEGMMFKKSPDPMCSVGDDVMFTINEKGTIKIVKEGQEQFVNQPSIKSNDDLIMLQCMFKASAMFYSQKSTITENQVSETAQQWWKDAKEILSK